VLTTIDMPSYLSGEGQPDPDRQRWMMFVDGENITARAQETAASRSLSLAEGTHYKRDVFVWLKGRTAREPLYRPNWLDLQRYALRAYFYTSVVGGDEVRDAVTKALWDLQFSPSVFRKTKGARSKGVDIALTKDMLAHAFLNHYDVAVLASGDGDYKPVVQEVRRLGKAVHLVAFESGLSEALKLACDHFYSLNNVVSSLPSQAGAGT